MVKKQYKGRRYSVIRVRAGSRIDQRWIAWCQTLVEARKVAAAQKPVAGYEVWIERLVDTKTGKHLGVPQRIERV